MDNITSNYEFIEKGGLLMWPLMCLSVYVVAVVILKVIQFRKTRALSYASYMNAVVNLVKAGQIEEAEKLISLSKGPVARVLESSLRLAKDDTISRMLKESEIERVGAAELRPLDSHIRGLEMTSTISPLIGLLGTVMGMVTAFAKIADNGARVEPAILAGGIWEALITTVSGLIVAIPALGAYHVIDSYIEKVRGAMKDAATMILVLEPNIKAAMAKSAERDRLRLVPQVEEPITRTQFAQPAAPQAAPQEAQIVQEREQEPQAEPEEQVKQTADQNVW